MNALSFGSDTEQIERAMNLLMAPGQVVEIRAIKLVPRKFIVSGYYNDVGALSDGVENMAEFCDRDGGRFMGIFFNLQRLNPAVLGRAYNRYTSGIDGTKTEDIERVVCLPLDFDSVKPKGVCATEAERRVTLGRAHECVDYWTAKGFPQPLFWSTGNGAQMIWGLDLPPDTDLLKRFIAENKRLFGGNGVDVDESVADVTQIFRLPGTWNRKGDNMPDRKHRMAEIISAPDSLDVVPVELLESLLPAAAKVSAKHSATTGEVFDLVGFLDKHSVEYVAKPHDKYGTIYQLPKCPFDDHQEDFKSGVFLRDGKPCFHCFKDGCGERSWADFQRSILSASAPAAVPSPALPESHNDSHRLARVFLSRYQHTDAPKYCYSSGSPYVWHEGFWQQQDQNEINLELAEAIKAEFDRWGPVGKSKTIANVTKTVVANVAQALNSMTRHKGDKPPFWIGGDEAWPAGEVLACRNGLVHLPSYVDGKPDYMRPLTPRFFSTLNLGYDFEPSGKPPRRWLDFLNELWPNDPDSIALVQEYGGYLLTLDTRYQKALMVKGPPRSGKGTICRVWEKMLGPSNVEATSLNALADPHGLESLVGKSFATMGDEKIERKTDRAAAVRNLLGIIGEDTVSINPKFRPRFSCRLAARFAICTNDLLDLPDSAGALAARLLVLRMTHSFLGKENTGLLGELTKELPGILRWHIEGWARLQKRGVFTQPASGAELLDDFREANGPIGAFIKARCVLEAGHWASRLDLYAAYQQWCGATGRTPVSEPEFCRELGSAAPGVRESRPGNGRDELVRPRGFAGIGLAVGEPETVQIVLPADLLAEYPADPAVYALLVRCLFEGVGQPLPPDLLATAG